MTALSEQNSSSPERRLLPFVIVLLGLAVFIITWVGIRENRADSFALLVHQGKAFTEALAQASENAILAESYYDRMVQARYTELVSVIAEDELETLTDDDLVSFARTHDLYGVYVFGIDSSLIAGSTARGPQISLPEFVSEEVAQLISKPESNYVQLLDQGGPAGEVVHYYLELTNRLDRVVVLVVDALYYIEALDQTGIGYLARNMARERGVEYIIYQSTDGIIFASRRPGSLLAIESDPFLTASLEIDTINSREYEFQGSPVLELVRPFSTDRFPFGLFRVGLSLDDYYAISRGYDLQMAALAVVIFVLVLVAVLYLNSREKRRRIGRQFQQMKSVTDKIFEQMQTGVAVVDRSGEVHLVNQAFETIFGVRDLAGKRFSDVIPAEVLSIERSSEQAGDVDEAEVSLPMGGETRTLLVARSSMAQQESGLEAQLLVVYDITRLKEYERVANRKERLSEMGDLAAGVAHEIRNPLNTISIAIQRLAVEFVPDQGSQEYLAFTDKIRSETKRLNEIITRFLALAREDRRRRRAVNPDTVIRDLLKFVEAEADRLEITLKSQLAADVEIDADPDQLKELFVNLYNNAKEALNEQPGRVAVSTESRDGRLVIRFSDSGPGIEENLREKVFSPYFTTKEAGTGLGLPTVYRIVTDLGGEIRVERGELGGATFVISLPCR